MLDVNVLVAWGWQNHEFHTPIAKWIESVKSLDSDNRIFTSPITELGFVRVSIQISHGQVSCQQAGQLLKNMLASLGSKYGFLPDDIPSYEWPGWCKGSAQTTDAHLQKLARSHGAVLAMNKRIPDAFLIDSLRS